ncbi:stalk domain-containing protein [Cohnella candidum]|uniref:Copper amine oxidase-like N-terminal domain-containing protein n=1 Tax=Cohnella candidum TaxID=2674991 RepID=A0A3G3K2W5_9BACL|nr:stalk domain-containing protein [Cohnella candidum]AYQ74772.1 hypothetical protein EAV92_20790 [Cohnella candidum]
MLGKGSRFAKMFLCFMLILMLAPQVIEAAEKQIRISFNGQPLTFAEAKPVVVNGTTLVPFRKLFETLGFEVGWKDDGKTRKAIGTKDGLEIVLTINDKNAKVNGKTVLLGVPAQIIGSSTMVPLRFVSENSGYQVSYTDNGKLLDIQIGSVNRDKAEPYVVKGRVVDSEGKPVAGAEVFADNQLLYNSNLVTVTDSNGYYRIELPLLATTWRMGGSHNVRLDGSSYEVDLTPEVDQPFAGNTGAVRNFTLQTETVYGEIYLYVPLDEFVKGYYEQNIEVTLTPTGGNGKAITRYGYNFPGGFGMNDVPVGKYKVTARYAPPGENPVPMVVRVRGKGEYAQSVEFQFNTLVPGIYQAELEFKAAPAQ